MIAVDRTLIRHRGFTLVELMVTITVLAILLMVSVPSFRGLLDRNHVASASNALLGSISYARAEAISRGMVVSMCPSTNGTACAASTNYQTGWIVYTYTAGNGIGGTAYDASKPDKNILLRYTDARPGAAVNARSNAIVSFDRQGQLWPAGTTLRFAVCTSTTGTAQYSDKVPGSQLDINGSGRASTTVLKPGVPGATCTP